MTKRSLSFTVVLGCMLAGCAVTPPRPANELWLTIKSEPPGARITCDATDNSKIAFGFAPTTIVYTISPESRKAGKLTTKPCTAVWSSGATSVTGFALNLSIGMNQQITLNRPPGVAGLDKDMQFALQLQQQQQQVGRSQADENAAIAAGVLGLFGAAASGYSQGRSQAASTSSNTKVTCTTSKPMGLGNEIVTECK